MLSQLVGDLRHAARVALRKPALPLVSIAVLAVGIAASTVTFSVVDGVLWSSLPYRDYDRLVHIFEARPGQDPNQGVLVSIPTLEDWKAESKTIEAFARISSGPVRDFVLVEEDQPTELMMNTLSVEALELLGTRPALGRSFLPEDEAPGADGVMMLTYDFWQSYFNGSQDVIGQALDFTQGPFTIIGVMPQHFEWPAVTWTDDRSARQAGWVLGIDDPADRGDRSKHNQYVYGLLRQGVTEDQARAEIAQICERIAQRYPATNKDWSSRLIAVHSRYHKYHEQKAILLALFAAVGSVLLIGCANIAGLLLTRASERSRELAVRSALGAGRGRIASQLLAESLLFSTAAGGVGLTIALVSLEAVKRQLPALLPRVDLIQLDATSIAFAIGATLLTGVLCGVIPAWKASRSNFFDRLRQTGAASADTRTSAWLVGVELALLTVLLAGAGLGMKSFVALSEDATGYELDQLLAARLPLDGETYRDGDRGRARRLHEGALERIQALPGVVDAGLISYRPFLSQEVRNAGMGMLLEAEGVELPPYQSRDPDRVRIQWVSPGYFDAAGIKLVHGRDIAPEDTLGSLPVAVVNERLAEVVWPGENPIGKRIRNAIPNESQPWFEVVGVVKDAKIVVSAEPVPMVFEPMAQLVDRYSSRARLSWLLIKTSLPPGSLAATVRREVFALDPEMPVETEVLGRVVERSLAPARFSVAVSGALAAVALVLALLGAFSALSSLVNSRRQEIGIRMALGADTRAVIGSVVSRAALVGASGVGAGMLGSVAVGFYLESRLYGVSGVEPLTLVLVSSLVLATVGVAAYVPARRAASVNPTMLLRHE